MTVLFCFAKILDRFRNRGARETTNVQNLLVLMGNGGDVLGEVHTSHRTLLELTWSED